MPDGKFVGLLRILGEEPSTIIGGDRCGSELHRYETIAEEREREIALPAVTFDIAVDIHHGPQGLTGIDLLAQIILFPIQQVKRATKCPKYA